jgi:WLM domain
MPNGSNNAAMRAFGCLASSATTPAFLWIVALCLVALAAFVHLVWERPSQAGRSKEDFRGGYATGSRLHYVPGQKWDLNDASLHGNDPLLVEEYAMLNALIDRTNALLRHAVRLVNNKTITKESLVNSVALFARRWKGLVQRVDARSTKDAAVTIDKEYIKMCLRDKDTNELHDVETAMFVLIHEIAHMSNPSVGHDDKFWDNMKDLLVLASEAPFEAGVVLPVRDFESQPVTYCGARITGSPDTCVKKRLCQRPY